jgi:hypothetical protein
MRHYIVPHTLRSIRIILLSALVSGVWQLAHAQAVRQTATPPTVQGSTTLQPPDEVLLPPLRQHRTTDSPTTPRTVAELINDVHRVRGLAAADWLDLTKVAGPPIDSMRVPVKHRARQLAQTVVWDTMRGLQADAGIALLIRAGDTARATTLIERRLAERGLSLTDSAFVLFTAANAYANLAWPVDFARAARYTKRLDALASGSDFWKPGAGYWQAKAHLAIGMQHYYLGHTDDVFAELDRFMTILSRTDYLTRGGMTEGPMMPPPSPEMARFWDLYAGAFELSQTLPDGAARMASLHKRMLELEQEPVPAALVALDTERYKMPGRSLVKYFNQELSWYGKRVPPMPGEVWLNTPDSTAHDVTFGDGNVYIVMHTIKCTYVPESAKQLERLMAAVPGVKVILRCRLVGHWGNVFLTPAEELAALKAKFATELRSSIPVSVWVGEKVRTRDNGYVLTPDPTGGTVFASGKFVQYIDKQGRSRLLVAELLKGPGEIEHRQILLLRRLMAEPANPSSSAAPSPISPAGRS